MQPETSFSIRLIQFVVAVLQKWLTPIITTAALAVINWVVGIDAEAAKNLNLDHAQIVAVTLSVIGVVATFLLTALLRKLTKHVSGLQTILQNKGFAVDVDGWFGTQALSATVRAINAPDVRVSVIEERLANEQPK